MKVETLKIDYPNPLVNQYLYNFSSVRDLFEFCPYGEQGFCDRLTSVMREYGTDREQLVRVLLPYNRQMGCGAQTEENIKKLKGKNAVVVITGQQAGIFTGPLYTIHKTISVLQLARQKSRELGVPVLPVFWVASEDHDYQEINHLNLINREGCLERRVLDYEPDRKVSVGNIPVTQSVIDIIDWLADSTNPAEWKEHLVEDLKVFAAASDNLADWFARIMMNLFKDYGLIIVNPLLPGIREMLAPLFGQFIEATESVNDAFKRGQQQVQALGVEPQVDKSPENLHLFRYVDGERLPLIREGDSYIVRGKDLSWSRAQLLADAQTSPALFSPNVVLRPIAQDYVFPILAYVAGPGEIAYYALYRDIYPLFGMTMPIIYPRANITLLEGNIMKLLHKYNLEFTNVTGGLDGLLREQLRKLEEVDTQLLFGCCKEQINSLFEELNAETAKIDSGLPKTGNEALSKILHQVNYYMEKAQQAHRKKNEVVVRHFDKISTSLFPHKNFQERVFNIYPLLFKHGPDFLNNLMELPLIETVEHKVVFINP